MILKLAIGFTTIKNDFQQVLRVKKERKKNDPSKFNFPNGRAIFVNEICVLITKCYRANVRSSGKRN